MKRGWFHGAFTIFDWKEHQKPIKSCLYIEIESNVVFSQMLNDALVNGRLVRSNNKIGSFINRKRDSADYDTVMSSSSSSSF